MHNNDIIRNTSSDNYIITKKVVLLFSVKLQFGRIR